MLQTVVFARTFICNHAWHVGIKSGNKTCAFKLLICTHPGRWLQTSHHNLILWMVVWIARVTGGIMRWSGGFQGNWSQVITADLRITTISCFLNYCVVVGWLSNLLIDWLIDWSIYWLTNWLIDWLINRSIMTYGLTHSLCAGIQLAGQEWLAEGC